MTPEKDEPIRIDIIPVDKLTTCEAGKRLADILLEEISSGVPKTEEENPFPEFSPAQKEAVISTLVGLGFEKTSDTPLNFKKPPCEEIKVRLIKCYEGPGETTLSLISRDPTALATCRWNSDETAEVIQQKLSDLVDELFKEIAQSQESTKLLLDEREAAVKKLFEKKSSPDRPQDS